MKSEGETARVKPCGLLSRNFNYHKRIYAKQWGFLIIVTYFKFLNSSQVLSSRIYAEDVVSKGSSEPAILISQSWIRTLAAPAALEGNTT